MSWVADFSMARPGAAALKAAGAVGVVRYLCPGRNDGVNITAAEIADFNANSLPYGLVCEYEANWLLRGYNQGHDLATAALIMEQQLGIPRGIMYLACDFDAQPNDFPTLLSTMQGWADGYGGWQYVRPYGSKSFCEWVQANSPARGSWSTYAWSWNPQQGRFEHAADARLWQYNFWPIAPVQGCDFNEVLGDWGPRTQEDDLTPDEHNVLYTTAKAVVQLAGVIGQLVADEKTRSQLVTKGDPTHYGLAQVKAQLDDIEKALGAVPGGTVDLQPILDKLTGLTLKAS